MAKSRAEKKAERRHRRREAIRKQHPDIANCESPIERVLLPRLRDALPPDARVRVQVPIGPYRADFLVEHAPARIVVEADGKAYHTAPEDVERDRRRDEYMQRNGYAVVRFTGSEIVRNAAACARQVAERLGVVRAQPPKRAKRIKQKKPKRKFATWKEAMVDREWQRKEGQAMARSSPLEPSAPAPPRIATLML